MDTRKHQTNLTNILIDIYKNPTLGSSLGFKGGTCAMLFYQLPRFSVDLDFDYLGQKDNLNNCISTMTNLLSKKFVVKNHSAKRNTLFWLASYEKGQHNIKIEISTRDTTYNHYTATNFYGVDVKIIAPEDMIAHKMIAFTERPSLANRDLFDMHYFLGTEHAANINYEIITKRTGKTPHEFYTFLQALVNKINPRNILEGMGEVLTTSQKDWAKSKLLLELKGLIERQINLV